MNEKYTRQPLLDYWKSLAIREYNLLESPHEITEEGYAKFYVSTLERCLKSKLENNKPRQIRKRKQRVVLDL